MLVGTRPSLKMRLDSSTPPCQPVCLSPAADSCATAAWHSPGLARSTAWSSGRCSPAHLADTLLPTPYSPPTQSLGRLLRSNQPRSLMGHKGHLAELPAEVQGGIRENASPLDAGRAICSGRVLLF